MAVTQVKPLVVKLGRQADEVAEAVRVAERAAAARSSATLRGSMTQKLNPELFDEYSEVAGKADAADVASVKAEIEAQVATDVASERMHAITSPGAEPGNRFQTLSPKEYSRRFNEQLTDSAFAGLSIRGTRSAILESGIEASKKANAALVDGIIGALQRNPRWTKRAAEWQGDSPYGLQFHVDRHSDPTRSRSFIQFEDPKEMGLHLGSNEAAEGIIKRGGVDEAIRNQSQQADAIRQIAGTLDLDPNAVERLFGQAIEQHFVAKFKQTAIVDDVWDSVESIIEQFIDSFGANRNQIAQFQQGMKDLPTPNTTPLLFRGKNGLLLKDEGGFLPSTVARQLEDIFPDDIDLVASAMGQVGKKEKTKALQEFIESKGFDHIVYHNTVEDKGSLSIINWNPDLQKSPWDPELTRDNPVEQGKAVAAYIMGALGLGLVREEE